MFGYAPAGETTSTALKVTEKNQITVPNGYQYSEPCPYRSLNINIHNLHMKAAATVIWICNSNFVYSSEEASDTTTTNAANKFTDVILYNFIARRTSLMVMDVRVGVMAAFGELCVFSDDSHAKFSNVESLGTPWNATLLYLLEVNPNQFAGTLLPFVVVGDMNGTSTPSLWMELRTGFMMTNQSAFQIQDSSVFHHGLVILVGSALFSVGTSYLNATSSSSLPLFLVSQSSAFLVSNTTKASMTLENATSFFQFTGGVFIGSAHGLLLSNSSSSSSDRAGLPSNRSSNHSLQFLLMDNSNLTFQHSTVTVYSSDFSAI